MVSRIKKPMVPFYQLKITLKDIKPLIWRRIVVRGDTRLDDLHEIFQITMGWDNYHLHGFEIDNSSYGIPDPEFNLSEVIDETKVRLNDVIHREKEKFSYMYDFGDGWEHVIVVEKMLDPQNDVNCPQCIAGKRACPPEDCGGSLGYEGFLEAIHDPNHPEHDSYIEWIGGEFDPEKFELEWINEQLKEPFKQFINGLS